MKQGNETRSTTISKKQDGLDLFELAVLVVFVDLTFLFNFFCTYHGISVLLICYNQLDYFPRNC